MNTIDNLNPLPPSWAPSQLSNGTPIFAEPASCDDLEMPSEAQSLTPTQQSAAVMNTSDVPQKPFDELMYQVLSLLIKEEEKATLILRDAIYAERQWQKCLSDLLEKEHSDLHCCEKRNNAVHKVTDLITPLTLVAEGMAAIFIGGISALSLGAAALGGLLLLDSIFDDKAKAAMASLLGRGDEQSTKEWFQNICTFTSLSTFVLGLGMGPPKAANIAIGASKMALSVTEAGTKKASNDQTARLIESESHWENSRKNMQELLGDVDRQVKSVNSLFTLLTDLQKSTTQTTAQIF
jgi:hypothetical protein